MLHVSHVWQALIGGVAEPPAFLAEQPITDVFVDSRKVRPGGLFVALHGENTDGHLYLANACAQGAVCALAEPQAREMPDIAGTFILPDATILPREDGGTRGHGMEQAVSPRPPIPVEAGRPAGPPYIFIVPDSLSALQQVAAFWRAAMPAVTVGITGSVGKTTTKETVANVLAQHYVCLRSEGNLNNEIGLPITLLRLRPGHQRAVLEMGMYSLGEIARLCEIARPRIGLVTNVGPTHLERLGSIDRIAEAKAELVRALPAAEDGGVAILNADDPRVRAMAGQTRARVFTYGLSVASDLWADEVVSEGLEGIRFHLHYRDEHLHVHLPMLGQHSVHTALRATAVGLVEGLSWTEIITGLQQVQGQLRLMVAPGLRGSTLIDDTYNASPASMLAALNLLDDIANSEQRCVLVLGDMLELGSYELEGHRVVGGRVAQILCPASTHAGADEARKGAQHGPQGVSHHGTDATLVRACSRVRGKLVTVGARARWIAEEALAGGMEPADIYAVDTNADALALLQGLIQPNDIVLVKGSRGQAMEGIVDALSRAERG
jgi:UDP-N-acetylmuramoyl-tripeptide--D-alanyl-D-alanine ligase